MKSPLSSIVVGIANLEEPEAHLRRVVELARRTDAVLHIVHAFHIPDPAIYPYAEMSIFSSESIDHIEQGVRERLERLVGTVAAGVRTVAHAVTGPGEAAIVEVAEEVGAELIVTGATRHGRLGQAVLGTTAQRVLRGSRSPVLITCRVEPEATRRVLLTTDLSELSAQVHHRGLPLARALAGDKAVEARSLLVVAYDMPLPPPLDESAAVELAEMKLNSFVEGLDGDALGLTGRVRVGNPAEEIVTEASEWPADLLVLGTHGRTGTSRFLIGSVAESVLRAAPCDLLVIPNAAGESEGSSTLEGVPGPPAA